MALIAKQAGDATALLASTIQATPATDTGDAVRLPGMVNGFAFILDVTAAVTDAADTLDVKVQTTLGGAYWVDVVHFTQVLGNGGALKHVAKILAGAAESMFADAVLAAGSVRNLLGDQWRVTWTTVDADADASFTFSVTAIPM